MADVIKVKTEVFDQATKTKKSYEDNFSGIHKDLKSLYNKMKADKDFQGDTKKGYMEIFEILITFHKDMIDEMNEYYKVFSEYKKELEKIKKESIYKEVEGL